MDATERVINRAAFKLELQDKVKESEMIDVFLMDIENSYILTHGANIEVLHSLGRKWAEIFAKFFELSENDFYYEVNILIIQSTLYSIVIDAFFNDDEYDEEEE